MASDSSIYAQVGKTTAQPYNALTGMAQVAQTGNMLIQGRQAQMAMQSRNALQQAYQGVTIDPATGLPDSQQLVRNLQSIPGGGLALPEVIPALQKQQLTQFELNKAAQDQSVTRLNTVNSALASLAAKGSNVTRGDVWSVVGSLQAAGLPVDQFIKSAAVTMPGQDGPALHDWVVGQASHAWPAALQAEQFTPKIVYQNVGGKLQPVDMNPNTNPGLANSAPLRMGFTPTEQAAQVKGPVGPNGQPTVITQARYAAQNGLGDLNQNGTSQSPFGNGGRFPSALLNPNRQGGNTQAPPPGSIGAGSPNYAQPGASSPTAAPSSSATVTPAAAPPPAPGTPQFITHADARFPAPGAAGAQPPAPQAQAVSAQPGVPAAPPAAVGVPAAPVPQYGTPMATGLGPAQQAAATAQGAQGQDASGALFAAAQDSPQRQAQINAMLGDLTKYGSGPNSPIWQSVRGRMVQMGMASQDWTEGVAAQENFTKMANQFLAKQASSMGPVTNDKLALAAESGPNPIFTTLGNQGVLHIAQGNEDALTAKANAWSQAQLPQQQGGQGLTGADYQNWSTQFNQGFMPSAFWYARMAQPERQTLLAGMDQTQQAQLHDAIVDGVNKGWIDPTSLVPTAAPAASRSAPAVPAAPPPAAIPAPTQAAAAVPSVSPPYVVNASSQSAIAGGM